MKHKWALAWLLSALFALLLGAFLTACAPGPNTPASMGGPSQSDTVEKTYQLTLLSGENKQVTCQSISRSGEATYIFFECYGSSILAPKAGYMVTEFRLVKE